MSEQEQMHLLRIRQAQVEEIVVEILLSQEKAERRVAALEQRLDNTDALLRNVRDLLRQRLALFKECDDEQQEVEMVKQTLRLLLTQYDSLPD